MRGLLPLALFTLAGPVQAQLVVNPCCVKKQVLAVDSFRIFTATVVDSVRGKGGNLQAYPRTRIDSLVKVLPAPVPVPTPTPAPVPAPTPTPIPTPPPAELGVPFGPYRCMTAGCPAPFTLSADFNSPSTIVTQIADARAKGAHIMLAMTGGAHKIGNPGCCLALINGVWQFSLAGWRTQLAKFNTAAIRSAIAAGVADGTIIGATVMDEPMVHGGGDGNTWGPIGTMTKAKVDGLCREVKAIFPTLAAGVEHQHQLFEPAKSYAVCDFIVDQYGSQYGSVTAWRDAGLAMAARDHHAIIFSMNLLNGGTQDKDGTWDCTNGSGGLGLYSPNCRMTAAQVKAFGLALGLSGCGMFMWRWDDPFMGRTDNKASFAAVGSPLATAPRRACRRS